MREPVHKIALFSVSFLVYFAATFIVIGSMIASNPEAGHHTWSVFGMDFLHQRPTATPPAGTPNSFTVGSAAIYFPVIIAFLTVLVNEIYIRFQDKRKGLKTKRSE